uniref:MHD domain-containing protein n=1 Tax=Ditylenchus dipsaci TaxID=166011 RepID=A0A915DJC3_9BILA
MINSLFIVNVSGDIVLEKHYKSVIHRSICDYFFDLQKKVGSPEDVPPVIATPHHYLFVFYHNSLYFIAVTVSETPPLMVVEILHRIAQTFAEYFEECSDTTIKENIVIVFELLDEILDNGYPLTTELNVLQDLIKPPNFLRSLTNQVTGKTNVSEVLPTGQLSNVPWRRAGVKYTNNEAYFDVIEEIDAIIDKQGATVSAEIQGYINCCCKLSGMPDLTMTLMNPRIWMMFPSILVFASSGGKMSVCSLLCHQTAILDLFPITLVLKACWATRTDSWAKAKHGQDARGCYSRNQHAKPVQNCNLVASHGKCSFDPTTKLLQWVVGKIELGKPPTLKGTVSISPGTGELECPPINAKFRINQLVISGLKVNRLDMYGEQYKPFKGVKYVTRAGRFQVRT